MKKRLVSFCCLFLLCFMLPAGMPLIAMAGGQQNVTEAIDTMVQEHMDKAKITAVSIAYIQGGEVSYLSYGDTGADEQALYQIGSTTKAFTALGVLWLEDEGLLSLNDAVAAHIPWFAPSYDGEKVAAQDITIANLLYQTSGFTNDESRFPKAAEGMTLEENVRALANCELAFYPSAQYAYANANYHILGLLIETVSGQSYGDFMREKILSPLGLAHTYASPAAAEAGAIVPGSRLAFFQSHPYEIPVNIATVPSGYLFSDARDMARWLQIHMGLIEVTEQFTRLVANAHIPDMGHAVDAETHYAGGWFVQSDGMVYHSGGTPNYSSRVMFDSESGLGVCVLTNINASANTERMAENIMAILAGQAPSPYAADIWTIMDTIFSILTFVCAPASLLLLLLLIRDRARRRKGMQAKRARTKKALAGIVGAGLLVVLAIAVIFVLPAIFASSWADIGIWGPYSLYTGTIAFALFSVLLLVTAIMKTVPAKQK